MTESRLSLYRAVRPEELDSIKKSGRFTNLPWLERKYFATTHAGAARFAAMAEQAYGDGPYLIVATQVAASLIQELGRHTVDRGIDVVVLPTEYLRSLGPPRVLDENDETA